MGNLSLHLLTFVYMYLWDFLPLNPSATTVYLQFMLGLPSNLPSFCILSLTNSRGSRVAGRGSRVAGRGSQVAGRGSRVQSRGRGSNVFAGENDLEFQVTE